MKSKVDAEAFAAAVKAVSNILKKTKIPQFGEVRVQFADDGCRVSATDLSSWLSAEIDARGDEFSFVFRNTRKMLRTLRHFHGELTVEPFTEGNDRKVYLHTGDMAGEFPVLEDDAHEPIPRFEPLHRYAVDTAALYRRVQSVAYATRSPSQRPLYGGVRFQDKRLWCVDGYRMAIHEDAALNVAERFVLPASALKQLRVFRAAEGELLVGAKHASITAGGLTLTCDVIEWDDDMKIETALPKTIGESYRVSRKQYLDALNYLADCTNAKEVNGVLFDGGRLLARGRHGKFAAKVDIAEGTATVRYGFNLAYMKQALEQLKDVEYVRIDAISDISPVVLHGGGVTAMVLPVRMSATRDAKAA